MLTEAKG